MKHSVLIVDDEPNIRAGLINAVEMEGYEGLGAENGKEALQIINSLPVDLVVTDLKMPVMDGSELLKKIYSTYPTIPVIVLTGHGTIEDAVVAMQNGAVDFLTKPVNLDHLFVLIKKSLASGDMAKKNTELQIELDKLRKTNVYSSMIGKTASITDLLSKIRQVAPSKASVMITGESGVGKEVAANALVAFSNRSNKPFVKVHCAALNENLLESELFGHVKGAFTGAISETRGRFEQADGGTIFLDEIGEISQSTQIKLLRVLQENAFEKVGGEKTISVDVRIIAATNRNLEKEMKEGRFREDLYFRLNVIRLEVPPLRERRDDIPLLATHFLKTIAQENGKTVSGFTNSAMWTLYNYSWPGNIRELRNCIEYAVVMTQARIIDTGDFPESVRSAGEKDDIVIPMGSSMENAEKIIIKSTLAWCKGNKTKTAEVLGLGRKTVFRKIEEYEREN